MVTNEEQHDLDKLGIAKNCARGEEAGARCEAAGVDMRDRSGHRGPQKNDEAYNARMAALYREVVLKEKPVVAENGFIPLGALAQAER